MQDRDPDLPLTTSMICQEAIYLLRKSLGRRKFEKAEIGHSCEVACHENELESGIANLHKAMKRKMRQLKNGRMKSFAVPDLAKIGDSGRATCHDTNVAIAIDRGACGTVTLRVLIN